MLIGVCVARCEAPFENRAIPDTDRHALADISNKEVTRVSRVLGGTVPMRVHARSSRGADLARTARARPDHSIRVQPQDRKCAATTSSFERGCIARRVGASKDAAKQNRK